MRLFIAELDAQRVAFSGDGEVSVAELADQVEGFSRRLRQRQSQRVVLHRLLNGRAHLRRGAKEAVCGDESIYPLMRPLEVVRVHVERHAPLAIAEIRELRAREKLLPERLPEALHLAERHRVLRAALDVTDAERTQSCLEVRLAAPGGVLPPVVGQHL